jgi:hypothetical protein
MTESAEVVGDQLGPGVWAAPTATDETTNSVSRAAHSSMAACLAGEGGGAGVARDEMAGTVYQRAMQPLRESADPFDWPTAAKPGTWPSPQGWRNS